MKFVINDFEPHEPVLKVRLNTSPTGELEVIGKGESNSEYLIASITVFGALEPNKFGCKSLGLTISNKYNQ